MSNTITEQILLSKFDDVTTDDDGHKWSQICNACTTTLGIEDNLLDLNVGHGICGVEECDNESNHYIDFPNK